MSAVETLGKYEIRRQLGRGATGTVYEGWDRVIKRRVAIKTVPMPTAHDPETTYEISRFRREAEAAGRLNHPNIVGVFDYGETSDVAYIVMEYVDGPTLKAVLDNNERFPLPRFAEIMEGVLAGLQYSHERGVVHRDIKPANLMLSATGETKIADFGIARIDTSSMTQAGTVLGTPAYMSPEQFLGQVVDARSDIYSAGALMYQLLTGKRPFDGSMSSIMHKALYTEAAPPSHVSVTAPRNFDAVIQQALAKRPEDRFSSASDFAAAIRASIAAAAAPPRGKPVEPDDATIIHARQKTMPASGVVAKPAPQPPPAPTRARTSAVSAPSSRPTSGSAETARPKAAFASFALIGAGIAGLAVLASAGYFLLPGSLTMLIPPREQVEQTKVPPPIVTAPTPRVPASPADTPAPRQTAPVAPQVDAPLPAQQTPPIVPSPPTETPPVATLPPTEAPPVATLPPSVTPPVTTLPPTETPPVATLPPTETPPVVPSPPTETPPVATLPPTVTPTVTTLPPTVMPPVTTSPPAGAPTPLEQAIAAARAVPCSALSITSAPEGLRISGFAHGGPELDRLTAQAGEAGRLTNEITRTEPFACAAIEAVGRYTQPPGDGRPGIAIRLDQREPTSGTRFGIDVDTALPALYVDLYQSDGMVRHLMRPARGVRTTVHTASVIAPSAGPVLITAIGAAQRLDLGARPEAEPADAYLSVLRPRLADPAEPFAVDLAMIAVRPAEPVALRPRPVEPAVAKPVVPLAPRPRPAEPAVVRTPPPRVPSLRSARCSNIVSRAQLGETLSDGELMALRTECRS